MLTNNAFQRPRGHRVGATPPTNQIDLAKWQEFEYAKYVLHTRREEILHLESHRNDEEFLQLFSFADNWQHGFTEVQQAEDLRNNTLDNLMLIATEHAEIDKLDRVRYIALERDFDWHHELLQKLDQCYSAWESHPMIDELTWSTLILHRFTVRSHVYDRWLQFRYAKVERLEHLRRFIGHISPDLWAHEWSQLQEAITDTRAMYTTATRDTDLLVIGQYALNYVYDQNEQMKHLIAVTADNVDLDIQQKLVKLQEYQKDTKLLFKGFPKVDRSTLNQHQKEVNKFYNSLSLASPSQKQPKGWNYLIVIGIAIILVIFWLFSQ
jgi:hypothetical protein